MRQLKFVGMFRYIKKKRVFTVWFTETFVSCQVCCLFKISNDHLNFLRQLKLFTCIKGVK